MWVPQHFLNNCYVLAIANFLQLYKTDAAETKWARELQDAEQQDLKHIFCAGKSTYPGSI